MNTVIFGSEGNVGKKLRAAFPGATGIDRVAGADIVADLSTIDYDAPAIRDLLAKADVVLHVATSPDVSAPDEVQYQAVVDAARLLLACQRYPVARVLLPSSDWAEPKRGWAAINTYGYSKRMFEEMAAMYRFSTGKICAAMRIGWVARSLAEVEAADGWLKANYWDEARLVREVKKALDL